MSFMRSFFASCLGSLVGLALFLLISIGIFSMIASSDSEVVIEDHSVLHLDLKAPITELEVEDPFAELFPGAAEQNIGLLQLRQVIAAAKDDPKIEGIYLNTPYLFSGISTISEIRSSLIDFKSSGKWVIAYADNMSEGAYYLSSVADKIYLNPEGQVEFNGLSVEINFFKKTFDKLEIKPQVFRVGDFKGAVEPFTREDLSSENRLQLNEMVSGIYKEMVSQIAASRGIDYTELRNISDKMLVRNAKNAVEYKLVDSLLYDDQIKGELRNRLDLSEEDNIPLVKYSKYRKSVSLYKSSSNEIAVIVADGTILPGEADQGVVGANTIVSEIRKARQNSKVKAIVMRINSPGGAFQSADQMWREIELAGAEKPVIASMADYAASGGYYLAMACDSIIAQPTTITGSIGVFSVLFDLSDFMGNKLGITSDFVQTGEAGEMITVSRPLTEFEKGIWQKQTDEIYETFVGKAAAGRAMTIDEIKKIASGRVWTGEQALENGLVDMLGSFGDAVQLAASKAGVEDYRIRYYPKQKTFIEKLMGGLEANTKAYFIKRELGEYYPLFNKWKEVKEYQGTQARMPLEFEIQ